MDLSKRISRWVGIACLIASIGLLVSFGISEYQAYTPPLDPAGMPGPLTEEDSGPPTFAWKFEEADSLNPDGNPETHVFLEATYPDGSTERKLVDTTHGSCSILPDPEEGSVSGTATIQCYGAGLGYRYRITRGEASYVVERKTFEEASPEYEPPVHRYEAVAEVPL